MSRTVWFWKGRETPFSNQSLASERGITLKKLTVPLITMLLLLILVAPYVLAADRYYTVAKGETLYLIAQRNNVSVSSLKSANGLTSNTVYPGQTLVIPEAGYSAGSQQKYTVRTGDSLWLISSKFGVSVSAIRSANGLHNDYVYPGQVLIIPNSSSAQAGQSTYRVRSGDSLYTIAQRFGTTIEAIKRANGLTSNTLRVGQTLVIPGGGSTVQGNSRYTVYVHQVRSGDTLGGIAWRYGVTSDSLMRANMLSSSTTNSWMAVIVPGPSKNVSQLTALSVPGHMSAIDFHKLARITYAEAGAEPYTGQVAVAAVVLNRVRSPKFPNTLDGVLTQRYQFEAVLNGHYYRTPPSLTAYKAAADAANGWDPSKGALYFFNAAKITNKWLLSKPVSLRVGQHSFAW